MKALVLSDIHSNIVALRAIWEAEQPVDVVLCAGDLVDYGPYPAEVLDFVRRHRFQIAQGNHDKVVADIFQTPGWDATLPQDWMWRHDNCSKMDSDHARFLAGLPECLSFELDGAAYLVRHKYGANYETVETAYHFLEFWNRHSSPELRRHPNKRIIFGHTHRSCRHIFGNGMEWINPGSVSYRRPDDPDKEAHYIVIEDGAISLRQVPYDRRLPLEIAMDYHRRHAMREDELQVAMFYFGDAPTVHSPLPKL